MFSDQYNLDFHKPNAVYRWFEHHNYGPQTQNIHQTPTKDMSILPNMSLQYKQNIEKGIV